MGWFLISIFKIRTSMEAKMVPICSCSRCNVTHGQIFFLIKAWALVLLVPIKQVLNIHPVSKRNYVNFCTNTKVQKIFPVSGGYLRLDLWLWLFPLRRQNWLRGQHRAVWRGKPLWKPLHKRRDVRKKIVSFLLFSIFSSFFFSAIRLDSARQTCKCASWRDSDWWENKKKIQKQCIFFKCLDCSQASVDRNSYQLRWSNRQICCTRTYMPGVVQWYTQLPEVRSEWISQRFFMRVRHRFMCREKL